MVIQSAHRVDSLDRSLCTDYHGHMGFNFCKVHNTLGTTPAHGTGIADGSWTIEKLIEGATTCGH